MINNLDYKIGQSINSISNELSYVGKNFLKQDSYISDKVKKLKLLDFEISVILNLNFEKGKLISFIYVSSLENIEIFKAYINSFATTPEEELFEMPLSGNISYSCIQQGYHIDLDEITNQKLQFIVRELD